MQYGWRIVQHFVEIASYAGAQFSRETCVIIMDIYCRAGAVQSSDYLLDWFLQEVNDFPPFPNQSYQTSHLASPFISSCTSRGCPPQLVAWLKEYTTAAVGKPTSRSICLRHVLISGLIHHAHVECHKQEDGPLKYSVCNRISTHTTRRPWHMRLCITTHKLEISKEQCICGSLSLFLEAWLLGRAPGKSFSTVLYQTPLQQAIEVHLFRKGGIC